MEHTSSSLDVYFKRDGSDNISSSYPIVPKAGEIRAPMVSNSNVLTRDGRVVPAQQVCARLAYNRPYVGKSVTDKVNHDDEFYKHQILVGRQMFQNDSCLVMHDPGTGKTVTQLYAMMELVKARVITKFVLVNQSPLGNKVAIDTLERIYNRNYRRHFHLEFRTFVKHHIRCVTNFDLGNTTYESYTGIVIDEAHNILTDNDKKEATKKIARLGIFMEKISKLEGIKLMLLSATPLLGDIASLGKFRQILLRNKDEITESIPPCLISYTQISYTHLKIIPRTNPAYPIAAGDRSFEMTNGVVFPFMLYVCKPSPMQIADFATLAANKENAPFQSKIKPLIVSSKPHKVIENGEEVTRQQSAIAEEVLKCINQTTDGTIIVYCELVEHGAKAMARFLDLHGFEAYTKRDSAGSRSQGTQRGPSPTRQLETQLSLDHRRLNVLKEKLSLSTHEAVEDLQQQLSDYAELEADSAYEDIFYSFQAYFDEYEMRYENDQITRDEIATLQEEMEQLKVKIEELRPQKRQGNNGPRRYLMFLSDRSKEDNDAFKLFNSEDNWDGSLIKVIIGSRIMRDGVDIHHAVQTHIIIPEWRIPGYIQAQHRGIRSAGHRHLIHHRAIKKVEASQADPNIPPDQKLTYKEALDQVVNVDKVEVSIYNHFVDFRLLDIADIQAARPFLDEDETLRSMSDQDIFHVLTNSDNDYKAGEAIIEAAIDSYKSVGAQMMTLRSTALDYQLNVGQEARIRDAMTPQERAAQEHKYTTDELLGTLDTELFFMTDSTELIIKRIIEILLKYGYRNTDDIFEELMLPIDEYTLPPTPEMIATAIVELKQYRGRVYHEYFGLELYVRLYVNKSKGYNIASNGERIPNPDKDREESILYLCTTTNEQTVDGHTLIPSIHPYIAVTESMGYSTNKRVERGKKTIEEKDIKNLEKDAMTFYKLQDVLEYAMEGGEMSTVAIQYLCQMSNYWGFSWRDLAKLADMRPGDDVPQLTSVYVLHGHIRSPDMNVLARNLTAYEYQTSTKQWQPIKTTSIRNTMLVRYGTLIKFYRDFRPFEVPEFHHYYNGESTEDMKDKNGIIMVKDMYNPLDPNESIDPDGEAADYVKNMFENALLTSPYYSNKLGDKFIVKIFRKKDSRGSQIGNILLTERNNRASITAELTNIVQNSFTLPFFLYRRDEVIRSSDASFVDIKLQELQEMRLAIAGTPTLRFQIYAIETQVRNPARKQEIYRQVYKLPAFLE